MAGRRASGEGALFQRQDGRHKGKWIARVQIGTDEKGKPIRKDFMFRTQAEAKDKLRSCLEDLKKGRVPVTKSQKLGDYLDAWLENRVKPNTSPNTYGRYKSAVETHVKPDAIAAKQLTTIGVRDLNDFFARRTKEGAKPPTIFNIRATLSTAIQEAIRDELLYDNPVRKTICPRQEEKSIRFLDAKQVKKLADHIEGTPMDALILTAIYTGMRLSELLGLTWDNVDFSRQTIAINQQLQRHDKRFYLAPLKTRGGKRTIPMGSKVAEKLKAIKGGQMLTERESPAIPNLVFIPESGMPWHRKTVLELTNELMKGAGVPEVGFHALRHTCASILINGGADALRVQRQLGHSSVRMTLETYSHLFEERLQGNVDLIDRALA